MLDQENTPFQKIIVGVDISDQTPHVLRMASYLSNVLNSKIVVCSVANMGTSVKGNDMDGYPGNDQELSIINTLQEMIHKEFGEHAEHVEVKILHGDPAERISEYADYLGSDLILVGSRGRGALKKTLLGSVSSSVANRSKKSVLILK